jgi:DNA (cytosine-5)-methyltransferase 1
MGKERNLVIDKRLTNFTPVTRIKGEVNKLFVRRMTPREWARLQGFPDSFRIVVSDVQAYKQFGNSVAIPVVEAVAKEVIKALDLSRDSQENIKFQELQGRQLDLLSI